MTAPPRRYPPGPALALRCPDPVRSRALPGFVPAVMSHARNRPDVMCLPTIIEALLRLSPSRTVNLMSMH